MLLEYRIWACESMNPSLPRGRLSFHCFLTTGQPRTSIVIVRVLEIGPSPALHLLRLQGGLVRAAIPQESPPPHPHPRYPPLSPEGTAGPSVSPCLGALRPPTAHADSPGSPLKPLPPHRQRSWPCPLLLTWKCCSRTAPPRPAPLSGAHTFHPMRWVISAGCSEGRRPPCSPRDPRCAPSAALGSSPALLRGVIGLPLGS